MVRGFEEEAAIGVEDLPDEFGEELAEDSAAVDPRLVQARHVEHVNPQRSPGIDSPKSEDLIFFLKNQNLLRCHLFRSEQNGEQSDTHLALHISRPSEKKRAYSDMKIID